VLNGSNPIDGGVILGLGQEKPRVCGVYERKKKKGNEGEAEKLRATCPRGSWDIPVRGVD
jgi:hypothetical protein